VKNISAAFILLCMGLFFLRAGDLRAVPGIIPVAKFTSPALPGGVPGGWRLERKAGNPSMKMEKEGFSKWPIK
jgi:hypothetical protein